MKPKEILYSDDAQRKIIAGAEKVYKVAKAAYGPRAGNVLLQKSWGDPVLSRDGVTNVREVVLEDPIENMAAQVLIQASKQNNQTVGDGTTAVVILAYHILKAAQKLVGSGHNAMDVSRAIEQASHEIIDQLDEMKQPITPELLARVATISAGDEAVGEMIADTIQAVGQDGGVTVEEHDGLGIHNEIVDGFYFNKGFTDARLINNISQLRAEYENVPIFICDKRLATAADIAPILDKIVGSGVHEIVMVGRIEEEALAVTILNRMHGKIVATVVEPPVYGGSQSLFLEDLAIATNGKVFVENPNTFNLDMLGMAEKVTITEHSTTILGADGDKKEIDERIEQLRSELEKASNTVTKQAIKDRLAKLTGKVAIIRVGAPVEVARAEEKLRVDDAVCAVQAAILDGVVPGGGAALVKVKGTYLDDILTEPFKQLVDNAGENSEKRLGQVQDAKDGFGFNLKDMTDEPIDLMKAGVVDPAKVIKEIVTNACSVAAKLITTTAVIAIKPESKDAPSGNTLHV